MLYNFIIPISFPLLRYLTEYPFLQFNEFQRDIVIKPQQIHTFLQ